MERTIMRMKLVNLSNDVPGETIKNLRTDAFDERQSAALHVAIASPEIAPFAKTGRLGDDD